MTTKEDNCVACGHPKSNHCHDGKCGCGCDRFYVDAMIETTASIERIVVALESIAKSLDAMAWEKR